MSTTIERYVIRHISGSKANQVEEFDFNKQELSIGRATGSDIQFDPEQEVIVSREHGKIVKVTSDPPQFSINDNNSRNGIFVNKVRVKGSATLNPGDEVQLGSNGPVFAFDIYPRPQNMMMETKIMDIPTSIKATTISEVSAGVSAAASEPVKTGLGKQTVERMLVAERKKSYGTMAVVIGALVIALGVLGYVFRDNIFPPKPAPDPLTEGKKTTDQIATENDEKVVQIEFGWQLYDTKTKEEYVHEFKQVVDASGQPRWMGIYIQNPQGGIEPFLVTKRNSGNGIPISVYGATGSGFVVSEDGYILTNRHVGAGWNTRWNFPDGSFPGLLFTGYDRKGNMVFADNPVQASEQILSWVPANAKMAEGQPIAPGTIKGENTYMKVVFSGSAQRREARLEQPSDEHDVALIKVNIPTSLKKVTMKDDYGKVQAGQTVTVMGYPGIAPQQRTVRSSKDPFNQEWNETTVPTPTVTPGTIGRIVPASSMKDLVISQSGFGDSYQLTVNATGGGNSGGPVFDDKGNVIGIFYASANDGQTKITFAVPIKYGLQLMSVRKASE
ncbi:MAG: trypsin-like peptidase domain-containing protein [Chitinophagaceae bacterium]|nr:trypsin-like peptidase domain-containing protein [Chitinophagaceae bacterium]